jgi:hypothetical protein
VKYEQEDGVKKRRILDRDFDKIEAFIKTEHEARKTNPARKSSERKWKEVDRQIAMEPMRRTSADGRPIKGDWHSALEVGELTKASEIVTADVMRIVFSNDNWFEPHVDLEGVADVETGKTVIPEADQEMADGLLRALMVQQHKDFGLKERIELAIKEALHHGSLACEIREEQQMMVDGAKIKTVKAPVLVPYSMWNAYPDSSPHVMGTNLFYMGSMIFVDYLPLHKLKRMTGEGWIQGRIKKVKKGDHKEKENETSDVQLVKFIGDICIERGDGDIYLPNMKAILANGTLVYVKENILPFPNVIYAGYERQDVRDPYYTSPIIKQSPMQKFTSVMANKFADAVELLVQPPVEYDANDPDYVANGGPNIAPGAKSPTKSMGKGFKALEIGRPEVALTALQFGFRQLQEGLGVSSLRQGSGTSDRQTATEAKLMEQGSEVRTIDFIGKIERQVLKPFLYMQHELNRKGLTEYTAYSNEMNTPDIVRFTKKEIDLAAHFDVVGAKGILGEQQRQQQVSQVTVFASGSPMFAPLLKAERILADMYKDAGKKNPEEWIKTQQDGPQIPPELQQQMQQMGQMLQQAQAKIQELESEKNLKMAKLEIDRKKAEAELMLKQAGLELQRSKQSAELRQDSIEAAKDAKTAIAELALKKEAMDREFALREEQIRNDLAMQIAALEQKREAERQQAAVDMAAAKAKPRKAKVRRTADGWEVEEEGEKKQVSRAKDVH